MTARSRNIAVVGCGAWGKNLVRNFDSLGALKTVCDTDESRLATLSDNHPGIEITSDYASVCDDSEIEAVAIAAPAAAHGEIARQALAAGKDVFVEKPLCLSATVGQELTRLARERKRILMVGHLLWYHPAVLALKELIDRGELGRIRYIYSNRLNLGKLRREENVLWSFAPHDISVILGLTGELPESVQAQGGNFLHRNIADTTVTLLRFASGVQAHIFVSWLHPFKEQKLVVVGDRKMAVFNDTVEWEQKLVLYSHSVEWQVDVPVAHKAPAENVTLTAAEPLRSECEHFIQCIAQRRTPRTDGEEGLRVLTVLNQCEQALAAGQEEMRNTDWRRSREHSVC
jgi:UDP-2-acetamido-3-amino-2,3-dideoxy-glucuronate N-acetyltransferase